MRSGHTEAYLNAGCSVAYSSTSALFGAGNN